MKPFQVTAPTKHAILPIILPPATLRPLAFRTFTKKHSLTLTSSALQELATFIGRHCGSGWREEGLAEKVLEEVARSWKGRNGGVMVDGSSPELKDILKNLEGNMSGGKLAPGGRGLSRQSSTLTLEAERDTDLSNTRLGLRPNRALSREDSQQSFGMSNLDVEEGDEDDSVRDARAWIRVVGAYDQPRLCYNVAKKHFEKYAWPVPLLSYGGKYADALTERHQNHHFCHRHRTKRHSSAIATTSFISASSATRLSRHQQSRAQERRHCEDHYQINRTTRSHQYPTFSAGMAVTTCSSACSWFFLPEASPLVT